MSHPRPAVGRWLAVLFAAFAIRHHMISGADLWKALGQAFPHRDERWRWSAALAAVERSGRLAFCAELEPYEPPPIQ